MPKSVIWQHFTELDADKRVTCLYCPQQLSVANKSTCSLIRHLTKKHPSVKLSRRFNIKVESSQEVLLGNDDSDNTDVASERPEGSILEYEIEVQEDSEPEEKDTIALDQKPFEKSNQSKHSKSKFKPVIAAMIEARRQIGDALTSLSSLKRRADEDEYDHFGHMIAAKLRKIQDLDRREIVMHSVYNVVYEAFAKNS